MKKILNSILVTIFFAMAAGNVQASDYVIIHAGTLLDQPTQLPKPEQTIIIKDGIIEQVIAGYASSASLALTQEDRITVYELKDKFVLPGLIDSHTHLTFQLGPTSRLDRVTQSDADFAMQASVYARRTLMAGFTTVRNVGSGNGDAIFAVRDMSNKGLIPSPRIFAAGSSISVTGGHADGTQGYRDEIAHMMTSSGVCDGPAACRQAVREQVRRGADHIKLTATGGVLSNTSAGTEQQFFKDELEAIMETAHLMGRKVTAHAHGVNGINAALRAGVDSIEHGTYLDKESIRLFKKTGAYLVPTVMAGEYVTNLAKMPNTPLTKPQIEKSLIVGPQMLDMLRRAHDGGVKIAFGTDSGVSAHGNNAREMQLMVMAGMSPQEVIIAATINAADNMGRKDRLGSIETGKYADIIAVNGNPLTDIDQFKDVDFVMKDGIVYKQ
ncbi:MAG: amidohydrolase family protein [bacterium]